LYLRRILSLGRKEMALQLLLPGFLKRLLYQARGYRIHKSASLGFGSVLVGDKVDIEKGVRIMPFSFVRAATVLMQESSAIYPGSIVDVENLAMCPHATIMDSVSITGMDTGKASFELGHNVRIFPNCNFDASYGITVGDGTGIGGRSLVLTHGSWLSVLDGYPVKLAPIKIEDNVWLAWNVTISPGVYIGSGAVLAPGAVVTKDIPSQAFAAGVPAKVYSEDVRDIPDKEARTEIIKEIVEAFSELYAVKVSIVEKWDTSRFEEDPDTFFISDTAISPDDPNAKNWYGFADNCGFHRDKTVWKKWTIHIGHHGIHSATEHPDNLPAR
jgi:acetyltransferase-like isoleucine patch superfamily enzyme